MRAIVAIFLATVFLSGFTKLPAAAPASGPRPVLTDPGDSFPVPRGIDHQLFYLQRNHNLNTIICQLNVKKQQDPDPDDPVHVFWVRYSDHGERAELSFIQRTFAYGIRAHKTGNGVYELHFAGYKKYSMFLKKSAKDNQYHVYAQIGGHDAILHRIFIKINGGSFWSPNVEYVELKGVEPDSDKEITERLKL